MVALEAGKVIPQLKKGPILNSPRTHPTYYGTSASHFPVIFLLKLKLATQSSNLEIRNIDCGCLICREISFSTVFSLLLLLFCIFVCENLLASATFVYQQ